MEGNSHANIKVSVIGSSCTIIIENGMLKLETWQGIYFGEFDGQEPDVLIYNEN